MTYFRDIKNGIRTTLKGLRITMRHLRQATERRKPLAASDANYFEQQTGLVTLQYPHEQLPIPDNGRYRLHNEIDDCIVCDKCAKVCPVDCITIDAIKATEEVGRASDGSPIRLYAATFDIDMAKCCYCGLCTVVCPTECLTMEKKFDYSEFELGKLTYGFANLTADQAEEKRALYEQFVQEKAAQKAQKDSGALPAIPAEGKPEAPKRPVFRPTAKPITADVPPLAVDRAAAEASPAIITSGTDPATQEEHTVQPTEPETPPVSAKPKSPVFRPSLKPPVTKDVAAEHDRAEEADAESSPAPEPTPGPGRPPGFRPSMKPTPPKAISSEPQIPSETKEPVVQPEKKTPFRPTMKPRAAEPVPAPSELESESPKLTGKSPAFRPTMKPKSPAPDSQAEATPPELPIQSPEPPIQPKASDPEPPKAKPAPFRPTMKPKNP